MRVMCETLCMKLTSFCVQLTCCLTKDVDQGCCVLTGS